MKNIVDDPNFTDQEKKSFVDAALGIEAETFFLTKLGKYILEKASLDIGESTNTLLSVAPTDHTAISEAQTTISETLNGFYFVSK